ncbi:MAG: hypothetical protein V9E89_12945 [Ilumatobacteraceae bacterium]
MRTRSGSRSRRLLLHHQQVGSREPAGGHSRRRGGGRAGIGCRVGSPHRLVACQVILVIVIVPIVVVILVVLGGWLVDELDPATDVHHPTVPGAVVGDRRRAQG